MAHRPFYRAFFLLGLTLFLFSACGGGGGGSSTDGSNPPTDTSVSVFPAAPAVTLGATQQFTATVNGTGSPSQTVTWSAHYGTITSSGLYTAPSSGSTDTVTATSAQNTSISGTATITLGAPIVGKTYYVDPVNGTDLGDGSSEKPWKSLQDLFDKGYIETYAYPTTPYVPGSSLVIKNAGATIKGGDTIKLRDGDYGVLQIEGMYNTKSPISIEADDGASPHLTRLWVNGLSGWTFKGFKISAAYAATYTNKTLVYIEKSAKGPARNVTLTGCEISSVPDNSVWGDDAATWNANVCNGISITGDDMLITNNTLKNVNFALTIYGSNCQVIKNTVTDFAGDGMRGFGNDLKFIRNTIKNVRNVNDNHCDAFQCWANPDPCTRVLMDGNTIIEFEQATKPAWDKGLQGFGLFGGPFYDWTIQNNLVITSMYHGITLQGGVNCTIINNTCIDEDSTDTLGPPWIMVCYGTTTDNGVTTRHDTSNCLVRNNVAMKIDVDSGAVADHNCVVKFSDLANVFKSPSTRDFKPKAGSILLHAGTASKAPDHDIEGQSRPHVNDTTNPYVDIGAYELNH